MKFFLVLIAIVLVEFSSAAENICFDVEKYEGDLTNEILNDLSVGTLRAICSILNAFIFEDRIRSCMRTTAIWFLNKDHQKSLVTKYAINDKAKEELEGMVDVCFDNRKRYFTCMLTTLEEYCPEFADIYRVQLQRLGFDV